MCTNVSFTERRSIHVSHLISLYKDNGISELILALSQNNIWPTRWKKQWRYFKPCDGGFYCFFLFFFHNLPVAVTFLISCWSSWGKYSSLHQTFHQGFEHIRSCWCFKWKLRVCSDVKQWQPFRSGQTFLNLTVWTCVDKKSLYKLHCGTYATCFWGETPIEQTGQTKALVM